MKQMNEENMTPEQKEMFMKGVYSILYYNYERYESCSTPNEDGVACQTFDCLGQAVTSDLLVMIKTPNFISKLKDIEETDLPK